MFERLLNRRRRLRLVTTVWGGWHLSMLANAVAPSIATTGNLGALSERAWWRIHTTQEGKEFLKHHPAIAAARRMCRIEICAKEDVNPANHMEWWTDNIPSSAAAGDILVAMHPDVIWSDGSLPAIERAFRAGKATVHVPSVRVVAESIMGERVAELSGRELMALASRHLHPLFLSTIVDGLLYRPSTEVVIHAGDVGYVMVQSTCCAIAVDPGAVKVTPKFFIADDVDEDRLHIASDVDDMLMLSLAPARKDLEIIKVGRSITPTDLAFWAAHPDNAQPIARHFPQRLFMLRTGVEGDWSAGIRRATRFASDLSAEMEMQHHPAQVPT